MVENLRVLVAGSKRSSRRLSVEYLMTIGDIDDRPVSVKTAKNYDHVLRAVNDYAPDVVVVDTKILVEVEHGAKKVLYDIPGCDLCGVLKREYPGIPVIALCDTSEYMAHCENAGADAVLRKDCEVLSDSALEAVLKEVL